MTEATMTREQHRERHVLLHRCVDELIADYLDHNRGANLQSTIYKLMRWSHSQTINPTELNAPQKVSDLFPGESQGREHGHDA